MESWLGLHTVAAAAAAAAGGAWVVPRGWQRLALSRAKHRSLAGHSRWAQRLARWLPGYALHGERFFAADGADAALQARREAALARLGAWFAEYTPRGQALTRAVKPALPDLALTSRYRVPFQFTDALSETVQLPSFLAESDGAQLVDVDGRRYWDLAGSYGVNVLGYDHLKACMHQAMDTAGALGPVLGAYHPIMVDVIERLQKWTGHEQFSFHMSGTEAVMQAVRLARYHTGRTHVVRFCGAYHGWWEDVQPGPGNPAPHRETYTLKERDERALHVLRTRRDIACVLVNPLQALHPNRPAPGDSGLVDSSRQAGFDRAATTAWLQALRKVCTEAGIPLIFDEVFLGFRLAPGGAQEYFGVRADLVTYGKTLGGGFPVGVVAGSAHWMQRYRTERPADLCFARGTFNAHPVVLGAMQAFLQSLDTEPVQRRYAGQEALWDQRAEAVNQALNAAGVPLQVRHLQSIWTLVYTRPSRFNWMLQFYLRKHGLWLSWVGTGRLIFNLALTDEQFQQIVVALVAAAQEMQADGWWEPVMDSNRSIRRRVLRELWTRGG